MLCFFGSAADPTSRRVLDEILANRDTFDDANVCFFGVSTDPEDEQLGRVEESLPGVHVFWDFDRAICKRFGALEPTGEQGESALRRFTLVLDERLRVYDLLPLDSHDQHVTKLLATLDRMPPIEEADVSVTPAPVLVVPRIFEPQLCQALIRYHQEHGGEESGFVRDVGGKTIVVHDHKFKRRRDQLVHDKQLREACMVRVHNRLVPEIRKAFQFTATRIERYVVSRYSADSGGYFRAHRDNTTKGTEHRRFAVSLNLNTGDYEGGNLRFPEFGRRTYVAPAGGAVVFSCSLLHEATPITSGNRYAFLPFLYDDASARIRQQNQHLVEYETASAKDD